MAAVQMNVRLDEDLKREGDAVLLEAGYSPTEVVRDLWGFARRNRQDRRKVVAFMQSLRDPTEVEREQAARAKRAAETEEWFEGIDATIRDYCDQFGIDYDGLTSFKSDEYDQLLEEAHDDKYAKWLGLA